MGPETTEVKNNVQSLQTQLSGGSARYVNDLSTESFISIFHQVQKQQQTQQSQNDNFGLYVRDQKLDIEIARELEKKNEKSQESFEARLEQQQEKIAGRAEDYKPEIFTDTFLGTMIAIMEAFQNNKPEPFSQQKPLKASADNLSALQNNPDLLGLQAENQIRNNQNPSLRLVIDGVPSDQTESSQQSNSRIDPLIDLSEQDIALSYIFGNSQNEHQQLRKLSEGPLLDNNNQGQKAA